MKPPSLRRRCQAFQKIVSGCVVTGRRGERVGEARSVRMFADRLRKVRAARRCVYAAGNGGSAAIASHIVTDLVSRRGIRARTLHEPPLLTCLSNDHGYAVAFEKALERSASPGDLLIAVSSSGRSENILRLCRAARRMRMNIFTASGFSAGNPLRRLGEWNLWLDSARYGPVEAGHFFLLHTLIDSLPEAPGGRRR